MPQQVSPAPAKLALMMEHVTPQPSREPDPPSPAASGASTPAPGTYPPSYGPGFPPGTGPGYAPGNPQSYGAYPGAYGAGGYGPGGYGPGAYGTGGFGAGGYNAGGYNSNGAPAGRKHSIWFWLLLGGGVFVVFIGLIFGLAWMAVGNNTTTTAGNSSLGFGNAIGVIDVDGVILSAQETDDQLRKLYDDDSIKAIILHVNSPGGGAAASQEIYHEVLRLRKLKKKPIVTSVETVGASGAYYIASATDKIYANDASVVGSIGVIAEWVNYGELMRWAKLKDVTFQAGELKEAGTPTRDPTPAEAAYLQGLVDNMHQQFINDVAEGRGMKAADILPLATGRVWTGQQAIDLHLIDKVGGMHDCLIDTARSVGIQGEPRIVKPKKPKAGIVGLLSGDTDSLVLPTPARLLEQNPGFYFLWK